MEFGNFLFWNESNLQNSVTIPWQNLHYDIRKHEQYCFQMILLLKIIDTSEKSTYSTYVTYLFLLAEKSKFQSHMSSFFKELNLWMRFTHCFQKNSERSFLTSSNNIGFQRFHSSWTQTSAEIP